MKIDATTMDTLRGVKTEGNRVMITQTLPRGQYVKLNEVLEALGGKWSRKVKAHVFSDDPRALIDGTLDTGMVETDADMGFFPTPPPVAESLLEHLDPHLLGECRVLEPSAGEGDLAIVIKNHMPRARLTLVELSPKRAFKLRQLFPQDVVHQGDFLRCEQTPGYTLSLACDQFDYIAMNPPFDKRGVHIDHVRLAFEYLKPNGRLATVLPSGVNYRDDRKHADFRAWAEKHGAEWKDLDPLAFRTSGTDVRTVMLRVEKS